MFHDKINFDSLSKQIPDTIDEPINENTDSKDYAKKLAKKKAYTTCA